MSGSVFGNLFRVSTFGESHGPAIGAIVDGCPPRIPVPLEAITRELQRRRPGQSKITTQRKEADQVEILSGMKDGLTLGTPVALLIRNADAKGKDYEEMRTKYRPSHADYTYDRKFGIRAHEGGGRSSARETAARVAAGVFAQELLKQELGIEIVAYIERIQNIESNVNVDKVTRASVDANIVRCPDAAVADRMIARIDAVRKSGDSIGGTIGAVARNVPAGLGAPVFDRLEADLAKAMLSLPACKGFESGSGFAGTRLLGSEHNDTFVPVQPHKPQGTAEPGGNTAGITTATNHSGGIQGGISNGQHITIRAAFKPTATVLVPQETVSQDASTTTLKPRGRHDPCVLPRAVPIVEAMIALVLADHYLRQRGQCGPLPTQA